MAAPKLSTLQESMIEREAVPNVGSRLSCCDHLKAHPIPPVYKFFKRLMDIVGASILLLALLPVFVVIAILVKFSSRGPVFYKSIRIGLCGERFTFIKFRSMRPDADKIREKLLEQNEKDGPIFKMKDDPRITPIGRVLRRFSLDELPQLWSVLTGQMSLVGPRPPIPSEVEQYDELCMQRLLVKPGITCFWQVMGRSNLSFEQWMELDRRYLQEMGMLTDIKLLVLTPVAVFKSDGAY